MYEDNYLDDTTSVKGSEFCLVSAEPGAGTKNDSRYAL